MTAKREIDAADDFLSARENHFRTKPARIVTRNWTHLGIQAHSQINHRGAARWTVAHHDQAGVWVRVNQFQVRVTLPKGLGLCSPVDHGSKIDTARHEVARHEDHPKKED